MPSSQTRAAHGGENPRPAAGAGRLLAALLVLVACVVLGLAVGPRPTSPATMWALVTGGPVDGLDRLAVVQMRLPRTVVGLIAGPAFGVAGALLQSATRNPLGDPGLLGVDAGAAFLVALTVGVGGVSAPAAILPAAFAGALLAWAAVRRLGSAAGRRPDPLLLTVAGVGLSATLGGIVSMMRLSSPRTFDLLQVWQVGSLDVDVSGGYGLVAAAGVCVLAGLAVAFAAAGTSDRADPRGARPRVLTVVAVTLLAGGATALAGPVACVGLLVPHLARRLVGPAPRRVLAATVLLSPALLLFADVVGRVVARPGEIPVGILTACLGAPAVIALARRPVAEPPD